MESLPRDAVVAIGGRHANDGVRIAAGASNNVIGGTTPGAGNVIAFSGGDGIRVEDATSIGNSFRGNSIFSNTGLGIDLNGDGVTLNDLGDADASPNNLQNYPVLTGALAGALTSIAGTLNSTPNSNFTLEFFTSDDADPSGFGEGQRFLASTVLTTDASGDAMFDVNIPGLAFPGNGSRRPRPMPTVIRRSFRRPFSPMSTSRPKSISPRSSQRSTKVGNSACRSTPSAKVSRLRFQPFSGIPIRRIRTLSPSTGEMARNRRHRRDCCRDDRRTRRNNPPPK